MVAIAVGSGSGSEETEAERRSEKSKEAKKSRKGRKSRREAILVLIGSVCFSVYDDTPLRIFRFSVFELFKFRSIA